MAGRGHSDPGRKVEKLVAVNIGYNNASSALGNQRIRAGIGRRNILLIALKHALRVRPGQGGLDLGTDRSGHSFGRHGNFLRKAAASGYWPVVIESDLGCRSGSSVRAPG